MPGRYDSERALYPWNPDYFSLMEGLVHIIPFLHTVCASYSTHLYYAVMYCTYTFTWYYSYIRYVYAFSYPLARIVNSLSVYTGSFLPKCLPSESQDLICAGKSVLSREVSGSRRSGLGRFECTDTLISLVYHQIVVI